MITETILKQLDKLITDGAVLRRSDPESGQPLNQEHIEICEGYMSSVNSFISQYLSPRNGYFQSISKIVSKNSVWMIHSDVGSIYESLRRLRYDIENGLLKGLESQISSEIFDTFLDHGEFYLKQNHKNEAGVIIGITFEDTLRKFGKINSIEEKNLEDIINKLQSSGHFSSLETKRAKVCSGLRTSAAHARWDEFKKEDVEATLTFTRELISKIDSTI